MLRHLVKKAWHRSACRAAPAPVRRRASLVPLEQDAAAPPQQTPEEVVAELDKHVVGQHKAKKAVAIAVRDRWRRKQLTTTLQREVTPMNILMAGSTGTGKTEVARRLAAVVKAPFVKVVATKYTEVRLASPLSRCSRACNWILEFSVLLVRAGICTVLCCALRWGSTARTRTR